MGGFARFNRTEGVQGLVVQGSAGLYSGCAPRDDGPRVGRHEPGAPTVACVHSPNGQVDSAVRDVVAAREIARVAGLLEEITLARAERVAEVNVQEPSWVGRRPRRRSWWTWAGVGASRRPR